MDVVEDNWREEHEALLTDIDRMIHMVGNAARFRMKLHIKKGGWHDASPEALFQGLLKNLHEFYAAMLRGDTMEMVNEGCDLINRVNMILDNEAWGAMSMLQDHEHLLDELVPAQEKEDPAI